MSVDKVPVRGSTEKWASKSVAAPDSLYRAIFDATPAPLVAVTPPNWTIIAVNESRLQATGTTRAEQMGRNLFELFPDDPKDAQADGVRNLKASLERVVACGEIDVMPIQRYALRDASGTFIERWWCPMNSPVFAADGNIAFVIHRVEEVTELGRRLISAQPQAD